MKTKLISIVGRAKVNAIAKTRNKFGDDVGQGDIANAEVILGEKLIVAGVSNLQITNADFGIAQYDLGDIMVADNNISSVDFGLSIFPNPISDNFFIKNEKNETLEYQITDVNGRLLMSGELIDEIHNITFTKINSGVYLMKIINPVTREYIVEKIVK
ncbi:MAG: T9SS type A sorting domain-containing protein [Saprospiraceae bacterium]